MKWNVKEEVSFNRCGRDHLFFWLIGNIIIYYVDWSEDYVDFGKGHIWLHVANMGYVVKWRRVKGIKRGTCSTVFSFGKWGPQTEWSPQRACHYRHKHSFNNFILFPKFHITFYYYYRLKEKKKVNYLYLTHSSKSWLYNYNSSRIR